ncbi:MAG: hypothetical protein ACK5XD_12030 [Acidobacteriota bacterium]
MFERGGAVRVRVRVRVKASRYLTTENDPRKLAFLFGSFGWARSEVEFQA